MFCNFLKLFHFLIVFFSSFSYVLQLPVFIRLCKDEVWGIRKACAQVLPQMALLVSLDSRRRQLVPAMKQFIFDDSEWVIITALKSLGQFIASFAQPQIYGLAYNYCLDLFITNAADEEFRQPESPNQQLLYGNQPNSAVILHNLETYENTLLAALKEMDPATIEALRAKEDNLNVEQYLMTIVAQTQLERTSERRSSVASVSESDDTGISVLSDSVSDYLAYERKSLLARVPPYSENPRQPFYLNTEDDMVARFMKHCLPMNNNFVDGPMMDYSPLKLSNADEMEMMPRRTGSLNGVLRRETQYNLSRTFSRNEDNFDSDFDNFINKFSGGRMSSQLPPPPMPSTSDNSNNNNDASGTDQSTGANQSLDSSSSTGDNVNNNTGATDATPPPPPPPPLIASGAVKTEGDNNNDNVFEDQRLPPPPQDTSDDDELAEFNSHRYWYIPPPTLDLNVINSNTSSPVKVAATSSPATEDSNKEEDKADDVKRTSSCDSTIIATSDNSDIMDALNDCDSDTPRKVTRTKDVVSSELLECESEWCLIEDFLYMKDIDREMLFECAYCFPAVIFTFGSRFWPLFRNHFIDLSYNCQLSVRKTMAAAISQVALTIGRENTTSDLVDPYIEFLRDSEVVKIEALKNMAAFIRVVDPSKHELIINQLQQILIPAKKIMWRFRETLGYQIIELIKIYEKINKVYCLPYLIGLALRLMVDRYDCVRKIGVDAFIEGFKRINQKVEVLKFFRDFFAHNICWKRRQLYILTVDKMVSD